MLVDAGPQIVGKAIRVIVTPSKGSQVKFGEEPWAAVTAETGDIERTIERDVKLLVKNPCCEEYPTTARVAGDSEIQVQLQPLPAKLVATCDLPGDISVQVNGRAVKLSETVSDPFDKNTTQFTKTFDVSFAGENVSSELQTVKVRANETKTVTCAPR